MTAPTPPAARDAGVTAPDAGGGAAFVEAVDALWRWSVLAGAAPAKSDDAAFRKAETARAALLAAHADAVQAADAAGYARGRAETNEEAVARCAHEDALFERGWNEGRKHVEFQIDRAASFDIGHRLTLFERSAAGWSAEIDNGSQTTCVDGASPLDALLRLVAAIYEWNVPVSVSVSAAAAQPARAVPDRAEVEDAITDYGDARADHSRSGHKAPRGRVDAARAALLALVYAPAAAGGDADAEAQQ